MSEVLSNRLKLGHVRLHVPLTSEPSRWRWRVADALEHVSITVTGLPPRSILVVRHLSDPCPGALVAGDSWRGVRQWGDMVQARLAECWRQAARPVFGPVSDQVEAVWFADMAELLACLSWDVILGQASRRWWWQSWLRRYAPSETLFQLWEAEPRWMPPALALLLRLHGVAAPRSLVMALKPRQAAALCDQIAAAYDLPRTSLDAIRQMLVPKLPAPYWTLIEGLPPEPAALLALNLAVGTSPATVQAYRHRMSQRGGDSALAVERRINHKLTSNTPPEPERASAESISAQQDVLNREGLSAAEELPSPSHARRIIPTAMDEDSRAPDEASPRMVRAADNDVCPPDEPSSHRRHGEEPEAAVQAAGIRLPESEPAPRPVAGHPPAGETLPGSSLLEAEREGVRTAFGGVWYLVNVLVALEWLAYDDFDDLNAWHKLLVVAQEFLRDEIDADPLLPLLEDLAQQPLPDALATEWVTAALPTVWAFLAERLGSPESFVKGLREPALMYVTRTHIDVVFRLEQIRLEIRMAGLDQDPGWIPELAHAIALHFV